MSATGRRAVVAAAVLAAALAGSALVYAWSLRAYFQSDDFLLIEQVATQGFFSSWQAGGPGTGFFRPVVALSYLVDHRIWGLEAFGYHLTNVLVHGLNTFLLVVLGERLLRALDRDLAADQAAVRALAAGIVFLLLHCHSESVAWISGRTDVICTFFSLATVLAWCRERERPGGWSRLGLISAFALALGAKETAIGVPFVLLFIEAAAGVDPARRAWRARFGPVLALFAVVGVYLVFRQVQLGSVVAGYGADVHLKMKPGFIAENVGRFMVKTVVPPESALGALLAERSMQRLGWLAAFAVLVGLVAIHRGAPRPSLRAFVVLATCYFLCLVPAGNLTASLFDMQGERLLYLPSVFASLAAAQLLLSGSRWRWLGGAALLLFAGYSATSLWSKSASWCRASKMAESIVAMADELPRETGKVIVNLPDHYRGAYVFRNGFAAVGPFLPHGPDLRAHLMSTFSIRGSETEVDVDVGSVGGGGRCRLELPEGALLEVIGESNNLVEVESEGVGSRRLDFCFRRRRRALDYYYYTGRSLTEIKPVEPCFCGTPPFDSTREPGSASRGPELDRSSPHRLPGSR